MSLGSGSGSVCGGMVPSLTYRWPLGGAMSMGVGVGGGGMVVPSPAVWLGDAP